MADTMPTFRSALNGFNRTDVVQFIQNQTLEHEKNIRLLREEIARLEDALTSAQKDLELERAARAEAEANAAEHSFAEPIAPAATAPKGKFSPIASESHAPAAPAVSKLDTPLPTAINVVRTSEFNEMELTAYRRAEMTERMARERAKSSAERMRNIFTQADEKLSITSQDMKTLLDTLLHDFDQMQQLIVTVQDVVGESSSSLKAASVICEEL